jgi:hypothetical protein
MTRKLPCLAFGLLTSCAGAFAQDLDVHLDARSTCLDVGGMFGGNAAFMIPPGTYKVFLIGNTMRCTTTPDPYCAISTALIRIQDASAQADSAEWGAAIRYPTVLVVHGTTDAPAVAFVADSNCADNFGDATLRFHRLHHAPRDEAAEQ